jgi:multiple sugar transport system ATP-binding protein
MARIILEGIRKVYGGKVVAVDDLSLDIPDGLIVSLLGPSGCGKTTTMRLIAGFEDTDQGKIYCEGRDITRWPPNKRNISMVFQFPVVYDTISISDNIATPLRNLAINEAKIKETVRSVSSVFGIDESMWGNKASKLSISDRQRLSLAHAFAVERNLYILDEPFSNIDPKSRVKLVRYVREVQQRSKHTLIFVTHSQSEALTLSDKIAVMKDGKLLQYDSPENIYTRPVNTFVGWFLGNPGMNFIKCNARRENGRFLLDAGAFVASEKIAPAYVKKLDGRSEILLGIRPEHVLLSKGRKEGYLPAVCRFSEQIGSRLLLNVEVSENVMVNVKAPKEVDVSIGDSIFITFPEEEIILFDGKTERAI